MTYHDNSSRFLDIVPTNMTLLVFKERVRVDPDALTRLYSDLGPVEAECEVHKSIDVIVKGFTEIRALAFSGCEARLHELEGKIANSANLIGLPQISLSSRDLVAALGKDDCIAASAILTRLERMVTQAITDIWSIDPTV